ncbi:dehydrogenase [Dokdonella sp. MW10]|uniref:dehydrogenase n=1 Tax=Dokdonella sp. MW10 TaxID=2992926 RepID=UPI003F8087DE
MDHALMTACREDARALISLNLDAAGVSSPAETWHAVGMARIVSAPLAFDAAPAKLIGGADAYLERPGFWHGGAGIAACWYGAAAAIGETLRVHVRGRSDPHAAAHLGAVDVALSAAAALLRETAACIDAQPLQPHRHEVMRVRACVERAATEVIDRVGRALGPGPLCEDLAHARRCADLSVFIRQSHAERDAEAIGHAAHGSVHAPWSL